MNPLWNSTAFNIIIIVIKLHIQNISVDIAVTNLIIGPTWSSVAKASHPPPYEPEITSTVVQYQYPVSGQCVIPQF